MIRLKLIWLTSLSALALLFCLTENAMAQSDVVLVTATRATVDPCSFNVTIQNHNAAGKTIYKLKLELASGDQTLFTDVAQTTPPPFPAHWSGGYDAETSLIDSFIVLDPQFAIAPGASLAGFKFAYAYGDEYDNPKTINWTTYDAGDVALSTGTIIPTCTPFQQFKTLDTASVFPQLIGPNPAFYFTVSDRNDYQSPIASLRFQLQSINSGTMRPSMALAPANWILDSVTSYSAYFHTDDDQIQYGAGKGIFQVGLRANTNVSKHNFVWWASSDGNFFIDRDTIFNISITAQTSAPDADSVSAEATSGCLYQMTVKNYHVSNLVAPGPLTKVVIRSTTPGVQFTSASGTPLHWKATVNGDSIVYASDSLSHAIPSGIVSKAFSFAVAGSTTTPFTVGWTTFRPQGATSTGQFSTTCKVETPRDDSATISLGSDSCHYVVHVTNLHNTPASGIDSITLSIPAGSGQLIGNTSSLAGWNQSNISPTVLKYFPGAAVQPMAPGEGQDMPIELSPKNPGQKLALTWQTFGNENTKLFNGQFTIGCTPIVTLCDTVTKSVLNPDSCSYNFTIASRGTADILALQLTADHKWKVDSATAPPGWAAQIDASQNSVTYTNSTGIPHGETLGGFVAKFFGCNTVDSFQVVAVTTDAATHTCTTSIPLVCSSIFCDTSGNGVSDNPNTGNVNLREVSLIPNPTHSSTDLTFTVGVQQRLYVNIYDALGKTVRIVGDQVYQPGTYTLALDLSRQPSGSYYIRIATPYGVVTKRLVKE